MRSNWLRPRCEPLEGRWLTSSAFVPISFDGVLAASGSVFETAAEDMASQLRVRLELSQTAGGSALSGPVNRSVDPTFFLNVYVQDLRESPQGVVGGAINVDWAPDLVTLGSGLAFGPAFTLFTQGTVDNAANRVDEGGGLTSGSGQGATAPVLFFSVEVTATADGSVTFTPSAGDGTVMIQPANFALVGQPAPVEWDALLFEGATVEITSTAETPLVSIIAPAALPEGNAGQTSQLAFTVTLSSASSQAVTVNVATEDGTATVADGDYVAVTEQTLTFAPGITEQTVNVAVQGDTRFEADETVRVSLSGPVGATLATATATATILNDDTPPTVSIGNAQQPEGSAGQTGAMAFQVTLSAASGLPVVVQWSTEDITAAAADNDYAPANGQTLTFAPGATQQTISVTVNGDSKVEPDETFRVRLTNPAGATLGTATGTGTIANDDNMNLPAVSIAAAERLEGANGETADLVFQVTLSQASDQPVTVRVATEDNTATVADGDYQAVDEQITFAPGVTAQAVTVRVNGDSKVEPDETFRVRLADASGATIGAALATGTIRNDDSTATTAGLSGFVFADLNDNGIFETSEIGLRGVTVQLIGPNGGQLTAVTGEGGAFAFENLAAGGYELSQVQPVQFLDGKDTAGTAGGTVQNDRLTNINLAAGQQSTGNNFGESSLHPLYVKKRFFLSSNTLASYIARLMRG